ncbi:MULTISPECIES: multidrug effflux MFS transporter [Nonlabens]|uniref:multidrug effflux MFS transporter n=1 Tax=Nonlabens TaxID=363408 RepID=UPI000CF49CAC|nr:MULTISPECIES: multidrug effflux MFS transporter [Nonlabens]PQJ19146.1 Bcr/CflA family drug resistance efflux transporter [Nonlabens tegetincola]
MAKRVYKGQLSSGRRLGIILVLGSLIAIGPFSIDAYLPAFKQIAGDFKVDVNAISLTLTTYFIGIGLGQLAYGPLMDRFGRRKPLIVGLVLYIGTSLASAFAYDVIALATLRFFTALGACAGMVASKAIVRDLFDEEEVASVLSNLMLIMGIAPVIAPGIGGWVVTHFHWQIIFYGLAGFATLMLFNIIFFLPDSVTPNRATSLKPVPVLREYWTIYKNKAFFLFSTTRGFIIGALLGYVAAAPFIFMEFFEMSKTEFAFAFSSNAAGLIAGSQINRLFLKRYTTFEITYVVSVLLIVFTGVLTIHLATMTPEFWIVYPSLFLMMTAIGFQNPNATALALQPFTAKAGSASAFVGAVSMIYGSLASWYVSKFVNDALLPLALLLLGCAVFGHLAVEIFRIKYARGYQFAKNYLKHPYKAIKREDNYS